MRLILDTHAFIWWESEPKKLSPKAAAACKDAGNDLLLSVVSVWEMQIKIQLGKLNLKLPLPDIIAAQQANGLQMLAVELEHVLALDALPVHHRDPFDRLLIAQANAEGAFLVSNDNVFSAYQVNLLW
jgi:PIN domain nuclease of toxin-antitoxin system